MLITTLSSFFGCFPVLCRFPLVVFIHFILEKNLWESVAQAFFTGHMLFLSPNQQH